MVAIVDFKNLIDGYFSQSLEHIKDGEVIQGAR